jgi:hypothetical protein
MTACLVDNYDLGGNSPSDSLLLRSIRKIADFPCDALKPRSVSEGGRNGKWPPREGSERSEKPERLFAQG